MAANKTLSSFPGKCGHCKVHFRSETAGVEFCPKCEKRKKKIVTVLMPGFSGKYQALVIKTEGDRLKVETIGGNGSHWIQKAQVCA